jgi:hypothetical protein
MQLQESNTFHIQVDHEERATKSTNLGVSWKNCLGLEDMQELHALTMSIVHAETSHRSSTQTPTRKHTPRSVLCENQLHTSYRK